MNRIARPIASLSIRRQIILIVLAVSLLTTTISAFISYTTQVSQHSRFLVDSTTTVARLIAQYSVVPIEFADRQRGAEVLEKLRALSSITDGVVLLSNGTVFAEYHRESTPSRQAFTASSLDDRDTDPEYVRVREPIVYNEGVYGEIVLRARTNIGAIARRTLYHWLGIFGAIAVLAAVVAWGLERIVSEPIIRLTRFARDLTEQAAYDRRIARRGGDETGRLYDAFNAMLDTIQARAAERDRALASLAESEELYRSLVEHTDDIIFTLDRSGEFLMLNRAGRSTLGDPATGFARRHVRALLPDDAAAPAFDHMERVFASGEPAVFESPATIAGAVRWFDVKLEPVRDARGAVTAVRGIARDVTDARRTEEALRHAQKIESIGVLAGGIAHDFNNLLHAILGQAYLALLELDDGHPARENIVLLQKAATRAADLTRQLLAYSGRGRSDVRPVDLNALIRENVHLLEVAMPKHVGLELELSERPVTVVADLAQMQQVVMNLVINAAEATGDRRTPVVVRTAEIVVQDGDGSVWIGETPTLLPGRYVVTEVEDGGCGMTEETRAQIFDPFFTTKFSGRGLGLAAVLGIVRAHRGGIQVRSQVGTGTCFRVALPAADRAARDTGGPSTAMAQAPGRLPRRATILVVDDEAIVRNVFTAGASRLGFDVVAAADGERAIELYRDRQGDIDLVVLDLSMPGIGGEETFRRLRAIDPDARIVLSSGYSELEVAEELQRQGLAGFLHKPYDWKDLASRLHQLLTHAPGGSPPE